MKELTEIKKDFFFLKSAMDSCYFCFCDLEKRLDAIEKKQHRTLILCLELDQKLKKNENEKKLEDW